MPETCRGRHDFKRRTNSPWEVRPSICRFPGTEPLGHILRYGRILKRCRCAVAAGLALGAMGPTQVLDTAVGPLWWCLTDSSSSRIFPLALITGPWRGHHETWDAAASSCRQDSRDPKTRNGRFRPRAAYDRRPRDIRISPVARSAPTDRDVNVACGNRTLGDPAPDSRSGSDYRRSDHHYVSRGIRHS